MLMSQETFQEINQLIKEITPKYSDVLFSLTSENSGGNTTYSIVGQLRATQKLDEISIDSLKSEIQDVCAKIIEELKLKAKSIVIDNVELEDELDEDS